MENNSLYKQLKQIALDGEYAISQIKDATAEQIEGLLGVSNLKSAFIENMRRSLVSDLQARDDETILADFKGQLTGGARTWLLNHFPDAAFERGRDSGKPFVKVWLEGKS